MGNKFPLIFKKYNPIKDNVKIVIAWRNVARQTINKNGNREMNRCKSERVGVTITYASRIWSEHDSMMKFMFVSVPSYLCFTMISYFRFKGRIFNMDFSKPRIFPRTINSRVKICSESHPYSVKLEKLFSVWLSNFYSGSASKELDHLWLQQFLWWGPNMIAILSRKGLNMIAIPSKGTIFDCNVENLPRVTWLWFLDKSRENKVSIIAIIYGPFRKRL